MADNTERTLPIPDNILNDVRMLQNQLEDHSRQIRYMEEKKRFTHAKLWDLIGEKMPEARGVQCSINIKEGSVTVNKKPAIEKFMRGIMGSDEDDE